MGNPSSANYGKGYNDSLTSYSVTSNNHLLKTTYGNDGPFTQDLGLLGFDNISKTFEIDSEKIQIQILATRKILSQGEIDMIKCCTPRIEYEVNLATVTLNSYTSSDPRIASIEAFTENHDLYFRNDYYSEDFSKDGIARQSVFLHEFTHAWQASQAPKFAGKSVDYHQPTASVYGYNLTAQTDFFSLNKEQQAAMVADYHRLMQGADPEWAQGAVSVGAYKRVLGQVGIK
jgi:hypothetical protein